MRLIKNKLYTTDVDNRGFTLVHGSKDSYGMTFFRIYPNEIVLVLEIDELNGNVKILYKNKIVYIRSANCVSFFKAE